MWTYVASGCIYCELYCVDLEHKVNALCGNKAVH